MKSKGPLILALLNTVVILGVLGFMFYTRLVFKRPVITESSERARLAQIHASPTPVATPGLIDFEPVTVNIQSAPAQPKPADGTPQQIQGKLHYVTVGFSVEIRDMAMKAAVDQIRPVLMDKVLSLLGHKGFSELTTVQGRYILRSQILEFTNNLLAGAQTSGPKMAVATNVYFTKFIVQ